ncbi:DUF4952 domain-containing protein [Tenacibaculum xiamenense]|uniref:DUF4952 domain-containing protein n=1 Tax=Tenacibaculum xiamenense TaxID=1261553 RepID=UPI003892FE71
MMKFQALFYLFFISIILPQSNLECGDLLSTYAKKPQNVQFLKCERGNGQTILEADYLVDKTKHEDVERFLIDSFDMGELKFVCCGWEPEEGKLGYFDSKKLLEINKNYTLQISMYANAEKADEKGNIFIEFDKNKVEFYIKVKILEV